SGIPFTVNLSSDVANTANLNQRPNALRNPNLPPSQRTPQRWFDTTAFGYPAQYTFGNEGRDILIGPGITTFDASLLKNFPVTERQFVQFRFEVFNLTNTPNFIFPVRMCTSSTFGGVCSSPTFGRILSSADPRIMQFALKYVF